MKARSSQCKDSSTHGSSTKGNTKSQGGEAGNASKPPPCTESKKPRVGDAGSKDTDFGGQQEFAGRYRRDDDDDFGGHDDALKRSKYHRLQSREHHESDFGPC